MASDMKIKYILLFWFCIFLPLFYLNLARAEEISDKKPVVFSTWEGFELDKCASIWLIKNFIHKEAKIKFFPKGTINMEGVPFDVPEAKFRRYHNMSTFESLLKYHKLQDPILIYIGKIIHDSEINKWEKKALTKTYEVEEAVLSIITESKTPEEIIEKSLHYFDGLYPEIKVLEMKQVPKKKSLNEKSLNEKSLEGEITFSGYLKGNWQIWSVEPDGKNLSQITHSTREVQSPVWSPDGNKLAYVTNEGEIWILEKGQKAQKIPTPSQKCGYPTWSPDGTKIAFACFSFHNGQEDSDIWMARIKEKSVDMLPELSGVQKDLDWSPDDTSIVYVTGYWSQSGELIEELWMMELPNKKTKPLLNNSACNIQPSWSPDGEYIAFASDKTGNMEIWVTGKNGKNKKQLTHHKAYDADPCWSPDGSKICFVSTRGGKMAIWLMDKNGENVRQVTNVSEGDCKDPCWR